MSKLLSIAALTVVLAAPAFAQDAKPATNSAPVAPIAKTTTPTAPVATTGQVKSPTTTDGAKTAEAPKTDASKTTAPATSVQVTGKPTTPAVAGKSTEAPKIDSKPMGVGGPKVDDKSAQPVTTSGATTPATTVTPAAKPADVKKQ